MLGDAAQAPERHSSHPAHSAAGAPLAKRASRGCQHLAGRSDGERPESGRNGRRAADGGDQASSGVDIVLRDGASLTISEGHIRNVHHVDVAAERVDSRVLRVVACKGGIRSGRQRAIRIDLALGNAVAALVRPEGELAIRGDRNRVRAVLSRLRVGGDERECAGRTVDAELRHGVRIDVAHVGEGARGVERIPERIAELQGQTVFLWNGAERFELGQFDSDGKALGTLPAGLEITLSDFKMGRVKLEEPNPPTDG